MSCTDSPTISYTESLLLLFVKPTINYIYVKRALGQVVSAVAAALFGGTLDTLFRKLGLPRSGLSSDQRSLSHVKRINVLGNLCGVVFGCLLGLVNLLLIDTDRAPMLKLQASSDTHPYLFDVQVSNNLRNDATVMTIEGPDVSGTLASVTMTLSEMDCNVLEAHALPPSANNGTLVHDELIIQKNGMPIPKEELPSLAQAIVQATKTPMNVYRIKQQALEIQELKDQVRHLEATIVEQQDNNECVVADVDGQGDKKSLAGEIK